MKHLITLLLCLAFTLTAKSAPSDTIIASVPPLCSDLRVTARVSASDWTLIWDYVDSANFMAATFSMPDPRYSHATYSPAYHVTISRTAQGATQQLGSKEVEAASPSVSVKLVADQYSARLYAGDERFSRVADGLPHSITEGGQVRIASPGKATVTCCQVQHSAPLNPPLCTCDIDSAIASSTSPWVGRWQYLDRDISQEHASYSGIREAAVIPAPGGSLWLIYLGGTTPHWQPMQIKATLTPTIFANNCDLTWTAADGYTLNDDNWAELSVEGTVLTIHFPIYKSQIRFKKAR